MNVSYTTVGSIRVPDPVLDPAPDAPIGKYGRMRKRFLEQRRDGTLTVLVLSGKLTDHLLEIDRTAREQIEATVSKMVSLEGVTERLKAENQMEWLRRMNNLRARAEELALREIVYGE